MIYLRRRVMDHIKIFQNKPLSIVIVMTFWYVFIGTDLTFSNFLNFYSSLGIDHDPHVLYVHMTYVYFSFLMFHSSHDHMAKRSHHRIMIFYMTSEY